MGEEMKLIVLYGYMSKEHNGKTQRLIDGEMTCGYREYAECAGSILYVSPQRVSKPWEKAMTKPRFILEYIKEHPDAAVFSVKTNPEKNQILKQIPNFTIHYSCNAQNSFNPYTDISLVDTPKRIINDKCKLYVKGKNPDYWKPSGEKEYDYLLMGRRDDKNQSYFLKRLNAEVQEKRRVLWIGGEAFKGKVNTHHEINYTPVYGPDVVKDWIPKAKIGILYSEIKTEGFPQTFLEMTMSGVPVVYGGPKGNPHYFFPENCRMPEKKDLVATAEEFLKDHDSDACRRIAVENYSIQKSVERMLSYK